MRVAAGFALLSCFFLVPSWAQAYPDNVDCLLQAVGSADVKFVRNGSEYPAKEASDHLRMKMDKAGDQITTAEMFIEHIASRSSMTGEPYYIVLSDGSKKTAAGWLADRLKDCRK